MEVLNKNTKSIGFKVRTSPGYIETTKVSNYKVFPFS